MLPKPDARVIPSQDEFDSWCENPVTRFVAEAYRLGADKQRDAWARMFNARIIPADISMERAILKTREDAYMAFLETNLVDYTAIVRPDVPGGPSASASRSAAEQRRSVQRSIRTA